MIFALFAGGCAEEGAKRTEPSLRPPTIISEGVLTAGVDFSVPPFAGKDNGKEAGIDLDVAAAVADRLGLDVRFKSVPASEAVDQLASGSVDVVLGLPMTEETTAVLSFAGAYMADGPVFFSAEEGTITLAGFGVRKVGVQRGSEAYWALEAELGSGETSAYPALRDALQALVDGGVDVVAGGAAVGAYIARDMPGIRVVGQVAPGNPIGVAVRVESDALADEVGRALRGLEEGGVLRFIRSKWVPGVPDAWMHVPAAQDQS